MSGFAHLSVRTETTVTLGYIADTTRPEPAPEPPPPPLPMLAAPSAIADGFGGMARDMVAPQSMPRKGGFFASSPSMGAPARRGAPAPGAGGGAPEMKKRAQLEKEAKTDEVDLASYEEGGAPPADDPLPASGRPTLVFVHALNPYGFSWVRRVNEDNVDLNRNFPDWSQPLPTNDGYAELADILVPTEWTPEVQERTTGSCSRRWASSASSGCNRSSAVVSTTTRSVCSTAAPAPPGRTAGCVSSSADGCRVWRAPR